MLTSDCVSVCVSSLIWKKSLNLAVTGYVRLNIGNVLRVSFTFRKAHSFFQKWVGANVVIVSVVVFFFKLTELLIISLYLGDFCI